MIHVQFGQRTRITAPRQTVGHTGHDPVTPPVGTAVPLSVECTTPVLDGLCVDKTPKGSRRTLRTNYSRSCFFWLHANTKRCHFSTHVSAGCSHAPHRLSAVYVSRRPTASGIGLKNIGLLMPLYLFRMDKKAFYAQGINFDLSFLAFQVCRLLKQQK